MLKNMNTQYIPDNDQRRFTWTNALRKRQELSSLYTEFSHIISKKALHQPIQHLQKERRYCHTYTCDT